MESFETRPKLYAFPVKFVAGPRSPFGKIASSGEVDSLWLLWFLSLLQLISEATENRTVMELTSIQFIANVVRLSVNGI
jgi:hypothetical protein